MIAIIGAMEEEITLIRSLMNHDKTDLIANHQFITGHLKGHTIVLLKSGIGKVNASMSTTILHERFQPQLVINIGSAGGLINGMNIGDLIISNEVVHHDLFGIPLDYKRGEIPGLPIRYLSDEKLVTLVTTVIHKLNQNQQLNVGFKIGLIATGDSFIDTQAQVNTIKRYFPDVAAVEMEAAAIAQVCYLYKTPFIVIRALSDLPDQESPLSFVEYLDFAAKNSTTMVVELLKSIPITD